MSLVDFPPPFGRSEEDIRTGMDEAANAGLAPGDPEWVDPRPLTGYWFGTQPAVMLLARAHDRMNEIAATATVATAWDEYLDSHAVSYGDERVAASAAVGTVRFTGDAGTLVPTNVQVGPPQTDPDIDPPVFETTEGGTIPGAAGTVGTVDLAVRCTREGEIGNVAAGQITLLISGVPGVQSVVNPDSTGGGTEVESDVGLRERLQLLFRGGRANKAAYAAEALRQPGIGGVTVMPHRDGAGTVTLVVVDPDRNAVVPAVLAQTQDYFDPDPQGEGLGWAPVNHFVTLETPLGVLIYVTATVEFETGYSLDASGSAIALRDQINARVTGYIDSLEAGQDVVYNAVRAQFFRVKGVHDVPTLTIGTAPGPTGTADIPIDDGAGATTVGIASPTTPDLTAV